MLLGFVMIAFVCICIEYYITSPSCQTSSPSCRHTPEVRNENIDGAPDWCVCPIGHGIMINPVACADGHCYDRVNIEQWLTTHDISPRTGLQLRNKILIPIHALRNAIEEWIANNKD